MNARRIKERISWVGAVDWDRRLFDSLIPLPDGTSYNAYLVEGSAKTALLDTVDPPMADRLIAQLDAIAGLDYIIAHHGEQDHSGAIPLVLKKFPGAKVVSTPKAKGMLIDLLGIPEKAFVTVADGETISLGDKTLKFIHTPWVHWPETMVTYLEEDGILFSCDFFGSHVATSDLYVADEGRVYEAAKRYYAEIMMPFRNVIAKNLEKLASLDIGMIAPSHGPIYPRPSFIVDAYRDWVLGAVKNKVVLPYVSMHGSTKRMVDQVLAGPHPQAAYAAFLANALRPKAKFLSVVGSYGWGGKAVEVLAGMVPNLKVAVLPPVLCKGVPSENDLTALKNLAADIAKKHGECDAA